MKTYLIIALIFIFAENNAFSGRQSNPNPNPAVQLAENGVDGINADGSSQTTIVDANGNLKIVPKASGSGPVMFPSQENNRGLPAGQSLPSDSQAIMQSPAGTPSQ